MLLAALIDRRLGHLLAALTATHERRTRVQVTCGLWFCFGADRATSHTDEWPARGLFEKTSPRWERQTFVTAVSFRRGDRQHRIEESVMGERVRLDRRECSALGAQVHRQQGVRGRLLPHEIHLRHWIHHEILREAHPGATRGHALWKKADRRSRGWNPRQKLPLALRTGMQANPEGAFPLVELATGDLAWPVRG